MGRLTKAQEKKHDEAMALLSLTRKLNAEEIEFVYRHYSPLATHRVSKGAIFFTPYEMASDFAVFARIDFGARVIDYAAGIGVLTHHMLILEQFDHGKDAKHHICVEIEPEFVQIGKKLLPQVEWICGNIFDKDLMQSLSTFEVGIANPPFGAIPSLEPAKTWMKAKLPAHLATVELMLRMCKHGGFAILPRVDTDYPSDSHCVVSENVQRLRTAFPKTCLSVMQLPDPTQKFMGADPNVVITNINVDDVEFKVPYGFDDLEHKWQTATVVESKLLQLELTGTTPSPSPLSTAGESRVQ